MILLASNVLDFIPVWISDQRCSTFPVTSIPRKTPCQATGIVQTKGSHSMDEMLIRKNNYTICFPPDVISFIQPHGQDILKPMKSKSKPHFSLFLPSSFPLPNLALRLRPVLPHLPQKHTLEQCASNSEQTWLWKVFKQCQQESAIKTFIHFSFFLFF